MILDTLKITQSSFSFITIKETFLHEDAVTIKIIYFLGIPLYKKITA
jgi:hypothetical protein